METIHPVVVSATQHLSAYFSLRLSAFRYDPWFSLRLTTRGARPSQPQLSTVGHLSSPVETSLLAGTDSLSFQGYSATRERTPDFGAARL
ncbi:hypothetical protein PMIN05_007460 [Paraphaeosphaeria minitans]